MSENTDVQIVKFLEERNRPVRKVFFTTREIAEVVGLTIHQTMGHLEVLQSTCVVEKVGSDQWRLI